MRLNKYRAIKTEVDGIIFHSKKEAHRYLSLKLLQRGGKIVDIELQPEYEIVLNGKKICKVKLDFAYTDLESNERVTEDVKGVDNAVSRLKRKLVEAQYGIKVNLV